MMRSSAVLYGLSLTLGLIYPTAAHRVHRRAAGSASTTSAVPTSLLTAETEESTSSEALLTASASSVSGAATSPTATGSSSTATSSSVAECQSSGGTYAPFCKPSDGSSVTVGTSFDVTWDPSYFNSTTTVAIEISYANSSTSSSSDSVYSSDEVENTVGYMSIVPKKSWLGGSSSANITLNFAVLEDDGSSSANILTGPTVTLESDNTSTESSSDSETSGSLLSSSTESSQRSSKNLGLVVGLTIALAFICLLFVSGVFLWYRRYKMNNRGYGVGRSRNERLGGWRDSWYGNGNGTRPSTGTGTMKLGEMQSANAPLPSPPRPPRPVTKDLSLRI
ncbi:hypothetical protein UCRPC4_g03360 [Phaeomoniella chlamydospora]|uniref:Mid2 domain-containing protein n=1 Tax=Phaeomoniella chlamydospora TaxID=158046 RepID=A0A0G2GEX7_PHACM|nr:hypothetical protein UCRPC4_g03360 [Phaeomoniella chlamydospora]